MTVTEALKLVQSAPADGAEFVALLACGFTPLHLQLFLQAHLQQSLSGRKVVVKTGDFGDVAGTLMRTGSSGSIHAVACLIEWGDLDPRLGFRGSGLWGTGVVTDIVDEVQKALQRIETALLHIPAQVVIALSLPTLPLPPLFHTAGWQHGHAELLLDKARIEFAARVAERRNAIVVNERRLAQESPFAHRLDLKADLSTGIPYTIGHASRLASALATLIAPSAPKKGVITDLDDTLWCGLVGEIGPEQVTWDLAGHSQIHRLYQNLLRTLAHEGVLIAVASKNEPAVVNKALERTDLVLSPDHIFPVEVHWQPKSESVARILRAWNISADSVIFVDDSPMELGEVSAAHPGITCLQFTPKDPASVHALLGSLRDICGRSRVSEDDSLRLQSIRDNAAFAQSIADGTDPEEFLRTLKARVTLDFRAGIEDTRTFELVNKTNQFNLNGIRYAEADWSQSLARQGAFLLVAQYEDKFGPLGKIAAAHGTTNGRSLTLDVWVMSCRAFNRRIEYLCMRALFERLECECVFANFRSTSKNAPVRTFFEGITQHGSEEKLLIRRQDFDAACPTLYHELSIAGETRA